MQIGFQNLQYRFQEIKARYREAKTAREKQVLLGIAWETLKKAERQLTQLKSGVPSEKGKT